MNRIGMDELEKVIDQELGDYIKETTSTMREVVEEVTDSAVNTLKLLSPRKTGKYARGWKSKSTSDSPTGLIKTIHNRTPGLTHLLENGHAKQNGCRVEGQKHIEIVEKTAVKSLEDKLKQKL